MLSKTQSGIIFACLLTMLAYLAINAGLPAFPQLEHYFSVESTQMRNCMTIFLFSYAFAQPFWGTLSDRFGRRNIILIASTIAIIGALVISSANSIHSYALGLFILAIGVGSGTILARTILIDSSDEKSIHKGMSFMVAIIALMPSLSPIIGGHLLTWFNHWRAIYIFMSILIAVVLLLILLHFKESSTKKLQSINWSETKRIYKDILKNSKFMGYCIPYNLAVGTLVTFYALSPYLFIRHLHMAENRYGYLLILISLSYLVGIVTMRLAEKRISLDKLMLLGCAFTLSAGLLFGLFSFHYGFSVSTILIPIMCYAIGCGFISPIANARALAAVPIDYRGSAASILGAGIMAVSATLNIILSPFRMDTLEALAAFILVVAMIKGILFYKLVFSDTPKL